MIISNNVITNFASPYVNSDSVICFAKSQTLAGASDKVILIKDHSKLHMLFLNFTLSKVIQHVEVSLDVISDVNISNNPFSLDLVWSFRRGENKWRFRMMKKIMTLGNMQKELIDRLVI